MIEDKWNFKFVLSFGFMQFCLECSLRSLVAATSVIGVLKLYHESLEAFYLCRWSLVGLIEHLSGEVSFDLEV